MAADRWRSAEVSRFANLAEAATVTARQSRLVDRSGLSVDSNSSSQSSAASLACSGPNNSVTALVKADNSSSAISAWSAQVGLLNDSSLFMVFLLLQRSAAGLECVGCDEAITPDARRRSNWTMVLAVLWYHSVNV
ncbi:MAG TPA: hypothetical protein VK722_08220 [Candidatus Aquilonibacter sp.]|jgi:hypothetical protein|nr:hypothetical protein [Candidatus Aquilonibacter sp.]